MMRKVIERLEAQAKSWEKTFRRIQPRFEAALTDRSIFQAERDLALKGSDAVTGRLEAVQAELAKAKDHATQLEARLAEKAEAPTDSVNSDAPILSAQSTQLEESRKDVAALKKKNESLEKQLEYIRSVYQNAAKSASELGLENSALQEKVEQLEKRASENLLRIHQINEESKTREMQRRIQELKAIVQERDRDLAVARDEARNFKNGRRETRQASVPRSPRLGVMSPRPGRGGTGGSASRGTSPAPLPGQEITGAAIPGMQFFNQQPGNGRWGHLRD
jgi:chromosome segregation ATPase